MAEVRFPVLFVARTVIKRDLFTASLFPDRLFCVSRTIKWHSLNYYVSISLLKVSKDCIFYLQTTKTEVCDCVCLSLSLSLSVMYSPPLIVFFLSSVSFPLTLCFALLCHLSLLRLLLCVSCQVLDIIYDLVLCPDCETPDKTSISATNTKSVDSLLHLPVNHSVCLKGQFTHT